MDLERPWGKDSMTASGFETPGKLSSGQFSVENGRQPRRKFHRILSQPIGSELHNVESRPYRLRPEGESRHFDSPGHCKSMLPGFCFSCCFSAFFRFATERVAAGRQGTGLAGGKDHFRDFPHISSFFRFENVHFDISRYNS